MDMRSIVQANGLVHLRQYFELCTIGNPLHDQFATCLGHSQPYHRCTSQFECMQMKSSDYFKSRFY